MTADSLENIEETIIKHYESLKDIVDKLNFISDYKLSIMKTQLLDNLSESNHKIMLLITLKLCTSENT